MRKKSQDDEVIGLAKVLIKNWKKFLDRKYLGSKHGLTANQCFIHQFLSGSMCIVGNFVLLWVREL